MSDPEQYPAGKLNADDEGALQLAIATIGDTVVINFGKPIWWFGMDRDKAITFAEGILAHATKIAPKAGSMQ